MKFFAITNGRYDPANVSVKLLRDSCLQRGIEFVNVDCSTLDPLEIKPLGEGDLLYSVWDDHAAFTLERLLLTSETTSFHTDPLRPSNEFQNGYEAIIDHFKAGLPIIPTRFITSWEHTVLDHAVDSLGGYPLIIKRLGGSHGVGTMKLDSSGSFHSVCDYVRQSDPGGRFVLRKFISRAEHFRCIVLGNRVIDSVKYLPVEGDFRTNAMPDIQVEQVDIAEQISDIAIKAVSVLGLEFGGVDILVSAQKEPYIAEVNFPCYFPRCQLATGVGISGMMVDYLVDKYRKRFELG